jgi:DNA-binding SARP family transcriptional activator/predicted ATPase
MTALKIFLLGSPRIELEGAPVDIQRRKALALLAYLAVSGQAHSRDSLATFFWPELDQQRGRAYLRRDLAALNASLPGAWLSADREMVELNREAGPWLDAEQFHHLLVACREHGHAPELVCAECIPLLTQAAALYTGDFLAGFTLRDSPEFDDWQFFQTESLRQELATVLERLVQGLNSQGKADAAIPYARRWVALDPLHEPAQRQLIQVYDQAGQPAAALRQYEEYVKLLEEELGLPPEEETTTLYEAIKAKRLLGSFIKAEEHKRSGRARHREKLASEPVAAPGEAALPVSKTSPARMSPLKLPDSSTGEINRAVGREAELGQLSACLEQALAGNRQLVFITGEAGLGKTTLIETFLAGLRAKTSLWMGRGQCIEHHGAGEAYMPILEAWGRMCREPGGQALITLLASVAPTWLAQMPWLVSPEDFEVLQSKILATTRERMLREMAEAIETLTATQPLVLVLEDLHWSDYSTLDLLNWLARRQEPARLLLIGTYRPSDVKLQDHPLGSVVQDIQRRGQGVELPLPLLTPAAVETYLSLRFDQANLPAELAHLLHQRTTGNPLFIRTLVDSWIAHGWLAVVEGRWRLQARLEELMMGVPDTLRQLIEQQFRQLDPTDQNILEVASVAGMEFSTATVMVGIDLTEEEIERRCVGLAQQGPFLQAGGIVEWPDGTIAAQFRFSHYLYQEVLYERVPAGRQVRLHRQIGQRLEAGYGASAPGKAAELALHFVRGRNPERAITYLQFAAEQAIRRNAYHEAVEHLTQGLELLQRYPDLPQGAQLELTLQATLAPALIMTRGWAAPQAEQAYVRARELCLRLGDTRQLSSVLYGLASIYELCGNYGQSQALLEERLQLPPELQDDHSQLESHELLACSAFHQGAFTQALIHADQALNFCNPRERMFTPLLGENPAISSHHWAGLASWFLGYPDQALACSHQALNQARDLAYTFSLAHAHEQAAMLHQLRREEQAVYQQAEATITAAIQGGFAYWLGVGQLLRGWAVAVQGQAERGLAQLRQGLETCRATGAAIDHPYFLYLLADACGRTGRLEEAMAALNEAFALARQSRAFFHEAELHRLRGMLLLQQDPHQNLATAEAAFQQALDIARRQQAKSLELRAAVSLSRLWQAQGQGDQARSMLAEICGWFSEGFDTADLQEAKTLLEELGSEIKPTGSASITYLAN